MSDNQRTVSTSLETRDGQDVYVVAVDGEELFVGASRETAVRTVMQEAGMDAAGSEAVVKLTESIPADWS